MRELLVKPSLLNTTIFEGLTIFFLWINIWSKLVLRSIGSYKKLKNNMKHWSIKWSTTKECGHLFVCGCIATPLVYFLSKDLEPLAMRFRCEVTCIRVWGSSTFVYGSNWWFSWWRIEVLTDATFVVHVSIPRRLLSIETITKWVLTCMLRQTKGKNLVSVASCGSRSLAPKMMGKSYSMQMIMGVEPM